MGYERSYKRWEARVDRIVKKYKDDSRYDRNPNARITDTQKGIKRIENKSKITEEIRSSISLYYTFIQKTPLS